MSDDAHVLRELSHPHPGPSSPPVWGANTNVTVLQWDPDSRVCSEMSFFENSSVPDANCCQGGMFISPDMPMNPGILVAWLIMCCMQRVNARALLLHAPTILAATVRALRHILHLIMSTRRAAQSVLDIRAGRSDGRRRLHDLH